MPLWPKNLGSMGVVAGVVLAAIAWGTFAVLIPRAVASSWSAALGVPVVVTWARPAFSPLRLRASGVAIGTGEGSVASAARVDVEANFSAWLGGDAAFLSVEIAGPRMRLGAAAKKLGARAVDHLSREHAGTGVVNLQLRVDDVVLERRDGRSVSVAGFRLSDLRVLRTPEGTVTATAELGFAAGAARVVAEIDRAEGSPTLLVGADIDHVFLEGLAHVPDVRLEGRASGRLWFETQWATGGAGSSGGRLTVRDLVVEEAAGERMTAERLEVAGLRVDPGRAISIETLEAVGVTLPPRFLLEERKFWPWPLEIGAIHIANLVLDPAPPGLHLRGQRVVVKDLDTAHGTGAIEIDGTLAGGSFRASGQRSLGARSGRGRFVAVGLPLAPLFAGRLGDVSVSAGTLDADLALVGPPGLTGAGAIDLRGVEVEVATSRIPRALAKVPAVRLETEYLSLRPPRMRIRAGRILAPEIWVRRDAGGFEVAQVFEGAVEAETFLAELENRIARAFGASPPPSTASPPAGIRLSDGEVHVEDGTIDPPFRMRFRQVQALAHGPAGPEGPLSLELEARGSLRSHYSMRARSSAREVTLSVAAQDAPLVAFDSYVEHWTGYAARGGRLSLEARARIRPDPAALVGLRLSGVELGDTGRGDLLAPLFGAPLPGIVAGLEGPDGEPARLLLQVPGNADAPRYGFEDVFADALLEAVERSSRGAARPGDVDPEPPESEHTAREAS